MYPWIKRLIILCVSEPKHKFLLLCTICLSISIAPTVNADNVDLDRSGKVSISVQNTELNEVFEMLSREGKINILLSNGVSGEISVNLYDVGLEESVRIIAAAAGFAVEHIEGSYFIVPRTEAGKDHAGGITHLKTFKVQYSDPEQIAEILGKHLSRYGKITALTERRLLVVEELPEFLERIEHLLIELDSQPKQILIEARILEISLDDNETYGIDWSRILSVNDGGVTSNSDSSFGIQGLNAPTSAGFFFSLINPNITVALNALDAKGRVRTLSTPKLLALEHQEAEVIIGDRTGYQVTTTINQVTTESIAFLESGVILRVLSFVDHSGRIMMQIHPEVSTATVNNSIPSLSTTEVSTNFLAEDGQTIFIAGLMRNSTSKRREGVPLLSDIPLLGRAFSNSEDISINTETVVMITPYIVEAGHDLFMTESSLKMDEHERALELDKRKVEKKIEKKIGPVEIIESKKEQKNSLLLDDALTQKSISKLEIDKAHCKPLYSDPIYKSLHPECDFSRSKDDDIEFKDVFKNLLSLGAFL